MATVDKKQGISFSYSNIYQLYKEAQEGNENKPVVLKKNAKPAKLMQMRSQEKEFIRPMGVQEAERKRKQLASIGADPFKSLKENLNKLSESHNRLRYLLQELEGLAKKKS